MKMWFLDQILFDCHVKKLFCQEATAINVQIYHITHRGRSNSLSPYMVYYFSQIMVGKKVRKKNFFSVIFTEKQERKLSSFFNSSFWLYENQNQSTIPVGKYLFKCNNKDTRKTFIGVILVSLLLTLKKYSPSGTLSICIH